MPDSFLYHFTGVVQSALFCLTLAALAFQASEIRARKLAKKDNPELESTAVLSVNLIFASFLAFYTYLIYGLSFPQINYYLAATRFPACIIVTYILFEIVQDRATNAARRLFGFCLLGWCLLFALAFGDINLLRENKDNIKYVILIAGIVLIQGQLHQLSRIYQAKSTGAISFKARAFNLARDVSTFVFGLAMGVKDGWPLLVVNGCNAVLTAFVLLTFSKFSSDNPQKSDKLPDSIDL